MNELIKVLISIMSAVIKMLLHLVIQGFEMSDLQRSNYIQELLNASEILGRVREKGINE